LTFDRIDDSWRSSKKVSAYQRLKPEPKHCIQKI
jgi:hypothetical protein